MTMVLRTALSIAAWFLFQTAGVCADSLGDDAWPQWRGPQRDGRIAGPQWPSDLSEKHLSVRWTEFTGKIVWQTLQDSGGMHGSAFSSPVFSTISGVPQFVVQTRTKLAGVAPEDGTVLWSEEIPAFRGMNILTPMVIGDAVFTSSYGGRSSLFGISQDASGWKVEQAWSHKSQGYMSSPVVVDNHIYLHLRNQRFVCLDAQTGAERWTTKPFGKYWSMVANGDKLLVLDQRGELLLIQASPNEFKLIGRRQVAEDAWAHLAIVNHEVFVRDLGAMTVFRWQ